MDAYDNVYMYGSTASGALPGSVPVAPFVPDPSYYSNSTHGDLTDEPPATIYDTYLLKFDPETHLMLSTIFGGPGQDYACGITVVGSRVYVSGVTGSALFPTHAPVIPGADPYLVTTPSTTTGDLDAFMAQLGYDYTVGQPESTGPNAGAIRLYPNPATDQLTITGFEVGKDATVQVLDAIGRSLTRPTRVGTATITLDTSNLPPGSYIVRVSTLDASMSCAFMKQ